MSRLRDPRVILLTDNLEAGGLQQVVVDLANGLVAEEREVAVVSRGGDFVSGLSAGVSFIEIRRRSKVGFLVAVAFVLFRLTRTGQYNIVHSHQRAVGLIANIVALGTHVRVVEHVHNSFASNFLTRLVSYRGDLLIACGSAVCEMLWTNFGRRVNVRLVLNAVADPVRTRPSEQADMSLAPSEVLQIVGVGRLDEQKDPVKFVEVVRAVATRSAAQGTWFGSGPLRSRVEREIELRQMGSFMRLAGLVRDRETIYRNARVLVLTSRWEGLPLVALEAMAFGVPVVLPDVGSCADVTAAGNVGLLYNPASSPVQIADIIVGAFQNGELGRKARECRRVWQSQFAIERMRHQVNLVYAEAL